MFLNHSSERYALASSIAASSLQQSEIWTTFSDKLEWVTTHRVFGYFTSIGVIAGLLLWTFFIGNGLSNLISGVSFIKPVKPALSASQPILAIILNGVWGGFNAGLTLIIPFVIPFYLLLAVVESSGILTRVAFMMDSAMHKMGLHGKALIPIILGYGCSVPAIQACKIMETRRERLLAAFAITFAPCSARTIVLFGMVGLFVGIQWALLLYVVDIAIIFGLGRIAMKAVPGKSTGLIMEMSSFKVPSLKVVLKQTWTRTKSIIYLVFPIYIVGSATGSSIVRLSCVNPRQQCFVAFDSYMVGVTRYSRCSANPWRCTKRVHTSRCRCNFWHNKLGFVLLVGAARGYGFGGDALYPMRFDDCCSWKRVRVEGDSNNNACKHCCSIVDWWISI